MGRYNSTKLHGILKISGENTETHDFGDGLYCFRGPAMSFAIYRSWPLDFGGGVLRDNAAVIIFPESPREIGRFPDTFQYILTDNDLEIVMGQLCFAKLRTKMNEWDNEDIN